MLRSHLAALLVALTVLISGCAGSGASEKEPVSPDVLYYSGSSQEAMGAFKRVLAESRIAVDSEIESPADTWTVLTEPRELGEAESKKVDSFLAAMAGVSDQSHVATITARVEPVEGALVPSSRMEIRTHVAVVVGYALTAFQRGERGNEVEADADHPLRVMLRDRLYAAGFASTPGG
jgi:hypothetical protein